MHLGLILIGYGNTSRHMKEYVFISWILETGDTARHAGHEGWSKGRSSKRKTKERGFVVVFHR